MMYLIPKPDGWVFTGLVCGVVLVAGYWLGVGLGMMVR